MGIYYFIVVIDARNKAPAIVSDALHSNRMQLELADLTEQQLDALLKIQDLNFSGYTILEGNNLNNTTLMSTKSDIIQYAEFSPKIKLYLLLYVAFFLTITVAGIPFLLIWFLGLGQYFSRRSYESLKCKLSTHHLEYKKGVLFKVEKTIPLENIQDLTFIENPLLNYFDLRILKIETAGQSNPKGSDMTLIGIINSADFKQKVLDQRELLKTEKGMGNKVAGDTQTIDLLKEIRDILNDIKKK